MKKGSNQIMKKSWTGIFLMKTGKIQQKKSLKITSNVRIWIFSAK